MDFLLCTYYAGTTIHVFSGEHASVLRHVVSTVCDSAYGGSVILDDDGLALFGVAAMA